MVKNYDEVREAMNRREVETAPPSVVLHLGGGGIQGAFSNVPGLTIVIVDYDVEGVDEERLITTQEGDRAEVLSVNCEGADTDFFREFYKG